MILDERTEFADATVVAGAAGTTLKGDVVDLELASLDLGTSSDLWLVIQTTTEIITAGVAGTIRFQFASDAQAAIAVDGSATVHFDTGTLVTGAANANDNRLNAGGFIAAVRLPSGNYERYLGILVIIGTTAVSAGAINAFLTPTLSTQMKNYAQAQI